MEEIIHFEEFAKSKVAWPVLEKKLEKNYQEKVFFHYMDSCLHIPIAQL